MIKNKKIRLKICTDVSTCNISNSSAPGCEYILKKNGKKERRVPKQNVPLHRRSEIDSGCLFLKLDVVRPTC